MVRRCRTGVVSVAFRCFSRWGGGVYVVMVRHVLCKCEELCQKKREYPRLVHSWNPIVFKTRRLQGAAPRPPQAGGPGGAWYQRCVPLSVDACSETGLPLRRVSLKENSRKGRVINRRGRGRPGNLWCLAARAAGACGLWGCSRRAGSARTVGQLYEKRQEAVVQLLLCAWWGGSRQM